MDETIGGRQSVTPPVLIASFSQGAVVVAPPSVVTPEGDTEQDTDSTKRKWMDVVEFVKDMQERDVQEFRRLQAGERGDP